MMDHGFFDGPWRGGRESGPRDLSLLREVARLKKIEKRIFAFLCERYVQRADERQKALGLQYMEAGTRDLAWQLAKFFASAIETRSAETPQSGSVRQDESAVPKADAQNPSEGTSDV